MILSLPVFLLRVLITSESRAKIWPVKYIFFSSCLFIVCCSHCVLCVGPLFCGVVHCVLSSLSIILPRKRKRDNCFNQTCVCSCLCSVSLPRAAVGWPEVCGCDISWSYSPIF